MKSIEWLDIRDNKIEDISVLSGLPNMKKLFFSNNKIKSIVPLSNMSGLRWVLMENNGIENLWPMYNLTNLTDAMAFGNDLENNEQLSKINKKVIEKLKEQGTIFHLTSTEVASIYRLEPSKKL